MIEALRTTLPVFFVFIWEELRLGSFASTEAATGAFGLDWLQTGCLEVPKGRGLKELLYSNRAHSDVHDAAPKDQTALHTSQMRVCLGFKPTPCFVNSEKTLEKLVETSVNVRTVVQWPSVITTLHGMDSSDDYPADMKQAVNLPLIAALPSLHLFFPLISCLSLHTTCGHCGLPAGYESDKMSPLLSTGDFILLSPMLLSSKSKHEPVMAGDPSSADLSISLTTFTNICSPAAVQPQAVLVQCTYCMSFKTSNTAATYRNTHINQTSGLLPS